MNIRLNGLLTAFHRELPLQGGGRPSGITIWLPR